MAERSVLAGSLTSISLADVFQILGGNNSTGVLRVKSEYAPNPGLIYFVNGDPVNASSGSQRGIDAIYALFGWTEGAFEFDQQAVSVQHVVKHSRMEIVMEALRLLDDGVIKKVGPPSSSGLHAAEATPNREGGKEAPRVIKGQLVDYSHVLEEEDFRDGERIVKEGGHGKWIWVILEGTAIVTKETSTGPVTIARIGEGCFIGTITALTFMEYTRNATVTASGNIKLGLLDTDRLSREYIALSAEFRKLLFSIDERFRQVTKRAAELSVKHDNTKKMTKGKKVIIKKGSTKKGLFTIAEGEACVVGLSKRGPLALVMLGEGDFFGHAPFIDLGHEPRAASVMGSKDLKAKKLDLTGIQKEYENLSTTLRNLIYNANHFTVLTTRMAYHLHEKK